MKMKAPENKLVPAGSIPEGKEFRDDEDYYFVVLDMQKHYFNCSMKSTVTTTNPIWVFNVNASCLAVYDRNKMIEPVELEVNVK